MLSNSKKYEVWIDDNYSAISDPQSYFKHAEFSNKEDAITCCEGILIDSLADGYSPGVPFENLILNWEKGGDDPFIVASDCDFSARGYLKMKEGDQKYFDKIKNTYKLKTRKNKIKKYLISNLLILIGVLLVLMYIADKI